MQTAKYPKYGKNPELCNGRQFAFRPKGAVWSNDQEGKGYDLVLLGQAGETTLHLDELEQRLAGNDIPT